MVEQATLGALHLRWGEQTTAVTSHSQAVVGRGADCDLVVDSPLVSRRHLTVTATESGWRITDLGSSNGTFHNGRRITEMDVSAGAVVHLGHPSEGPVVAIQPEGEPREGETAVVTIGRDPDSTVVVNDLMVSRHHAELRPTDSGYEIVDRGSQNGTFVNGVRVSAAPVRLGDLIGVGGTTLLVGPDGLTAAETQVGVSYAASALRVQTPQGKVILDGISFALDEGSFLGVVGPSGSGKSTLVGALTGRRPATEGSVFFSGRDLYGEYEHLRQMIGYVPQDDVLHMELTVGQTLDFAAELRFPSDVTKQDRERRVAEVLDELGLQERRDVRVGSLSGGQRKRVSVALELLTRPSLLILDEPTSGLDPGYERSLMELLADLAGAGRTIIVVTHSVQSLHLCDRILCLAPGGRMAWFGPPDELTEYFGRDDYQEVFRDLSEVEGEVWKQRFENHPSFAAYVTQPLSRYKAVPSTRQTTKVPRWEWFRQFRVLTRRRIASIVADMKTLGLWIGLAVGLALILLVALPAGEFGPVALPEIRIVSQAPLVVLTVVLAVTELGAFNTIREVAEELPLYKRERAVGLSISAYVASKTVVFGVITIAQALILGFVGLARQNGPQDALVFGWAMGELLLVLILCGLAAMALGLFVSAAVNTVDRAMTFLPIIFVMMMILAAGGIFPNFANQPGLKQASFLASSHWGFNGVAASANVNDLNVLGHTTASNPVVDLTEFETVASMLLEPTGGPARSAHTAEAWLAANIALLTITIGLLIATSVVLRRHDGG
ncbi:MAG: FHA domain-containing protein [Acidimicrobiia bacterium]|nr:FHA domain-containing protein [Acidimicrobiia bacterium]